LGPGDQRWFARPADHQEHAVSDPRQDAPLQESSLGTRKPATADVLAVARDWLKADGKVAVATIVDTWGSAPVPVGGQMVIAADTRFEGSVSGGCVEGEVITEAVDLLEGGAPRTLAYGVEDETAWRVGLPCGGKIQVHVQRLEGAQDAAFLDRVVAARAAREALVVRSDLTSGTREVFGRSDPGQSSEIAARFTSGRSGLEPEPGSRRFVHALVPPPRVIVVGATHMAQVLADLVGHMGYDLVVVDPRTGFASPARFPGVKLVTEWPQDALPTLGLDPYTAVAALSHVGHIDDEALKLAVKAPCFYIGALGSRKNHAKRSERLLAAGVTAEELARIRCPIGLDIGASSPPEIAASVLAEIIRHLRGEKGRGDKSAAIA
jgi:xanthine dehydrogenase accessory factor